MSFENIYNDSLFIDHVSMCHRRVRKIEVRMAQPDGKVRREVLEKLHELCYLANPSLVVPMMTNFLYRVEKQLEGNGEFTSHVAIEEGTFKDKHYNPTPGMEDEFELVDAPNYEPLTDKQKLEANHELEKELQEYITYFEDVDLLYSDSYSRIIKLPDNFQSKQIAKHIRNKLPTPAVKALARFLRENRYIPHFTPKELSELFLPIFGASAHGVEKYFTEPLTPKMKSGLKKLATNLLNFIELGKKKVTSPSQITPISEKVALPENQKDGIQNNQKRPGN